MKQPCIVVIGSINMDLVTTAHCLPQAGETLIGQTFATFPGGKGANQAVACARLGAAVHMVGCVGQDAFGKLALQNLNAQGIHTAHVLQLEDVETGIATILVENGENRIIVVPGANNKLTPERILEAEMLIQQADLLLLQLETPMESIEEAARLAEKHGVPVILNPAPAVPLAPDLLRKISYLTPNEHELPIVLQEGIDHALRRHAGKIVMTKGREGAYYSLDGTILHQPGLAVEVNDTTGAGDTFNGALAVMLAQGKTLPEAVAYAVAAGSLSVTKAGAQSGMPTHTEVQAVLQIN